MLNPGPPPPRQEEAQLEAERERRENAETRVAALRDELNNTVAESLSDEDEFPRYTPEPPPDLDINEDDVPYRSAQLMPPRRIYLNGQLQKEKETTSSFCRGKERSAGISLSGFCRPTSWEESARAVPGFSTVYSSPDGKSGAAVFAISIPALRLRASSSVTSLGRVAWSACSMNTVER
jgi:hypothetical protein